MMTLLTIGTAVLCIGISVFVFLVVHAAALRERRIENAIRIRDLLEETHSDRAWGDWPAMPSDMKVCHKGTIRHERY